MILPMNDDESAKKLRTALFLQEEAIAMREQRIRRENPDASESEIRALVKKHLLEDSSPILGCVSDSSKDT